MSKKLDLTGLRFGRLEVVSYSHTGKHGKEYLCQCECGNKKTYRSSTLRSGTVSSCGCQMHNNLPFNHSIRRQAALRRAATRKRLAEERIGKKYGRLTIVATRYEKKKGYVVICKCDCGERTEQIAAELKSGKVVSCGCYQREQASIVGSIVGIKNSSRHRNKWFYQDGNRKIFMRSCYEVMFAEALDKEGLQWQYEPMVVKLRDGMRYRPDFFVPLINKWYEVKGYCSDKAKEKVKLFADLGNDINIVELPEIESRYGLKYRQYRKLRFPTM